MRSPAISKPSKSSSCQARVQESLAVGPCQYTVYCRLTRALAKIDATMREIQNEPLLEKSAGI